MEQSELSKLIGKCREGDSQAQERLVLAVQEKVRFHCLRMLGDSDRADDAAQDILIAMLAGLGSLRDPNAFWGWLNQITVRCCRKRRARAVRELRYIRDAEDALLETLEIQDDQQRPDKQLDTEENRRMIVELVDALPAHQRECVMLYYYQELSIKEVARTLKVPEGTVKSRLHHARQAIKQGVDGYERQGLRLYGLSPLPFIQYFLQQEAAAAVTGSLAPAVMGSAAVSAAAGGAAASVKAVLAALSAKKAVATAALLLAGAVAGGVLLSPESETPEVQPIQAEQPAETGGPRREPQSPAVLPERLPPAERQPVVSAEQQPIAPAEQKPIAPAERVQAVPLPAVIPETADKPEALPAAPLEAETAGEPELLPPAALPEPDGGASPFEEPVSPETPESGQQVPPETDREPVPPAGAAPDPWPGFWTDTWFIPELNLTPDPVEHPQPGPDVEPDPEPLVINKNYIDFGQSSGYGFTQDFSSAWAEPLPDGLEYSSSNSKVVQINERGQFSTLSPGEAVLTARDPGNPDTEYALTIQVEDHFDWEVSLSLAEDTVLAVGDIGGCDIQSYAISTCGYRIEIADIQWKSSDSDVVDISASASGLYLCTFKGIAPGKATITGRITFDVETIFGCQTMEDEISFDITVEDKPFTAICRELTTFGVRSGYGYTDFFSSAWGADEALPSAMIYSSSDTNVAVINEAGAFTTLAGGPVKLTAYDPNHPDQRYVLTLQVQDHLDWRINFWLPTLSVGNERWLNSASCSYAQTISPKSWQWSSGDTSVVEVVETGSLFGIFCSLRGVAPGTATVTGVLTFEVQTVDGPRTMEDTVSVQATVE